jgi:hypothetical protein
VNPQPAEPRADVDRRLAEILARALVAEMRAEGRTNESPATGGTVQGSDNLTTEHDHRTPTAA